MKDRIISIIAAHVYNRTGHVVEPEPDDHLFEDLPMDSLDRVEILLAVEEEFGVPEINEGRVFFVRDIIATVERLAGVSAS